jgi:hypothetical protein
LPWQTELERGKELAEAFRRFHQLNAECGFLHANRNFTVLKGVVSIALRKSHEDSSKGDVIPFSDMTLRCEITCQNSTVSISA